MKNIAKKLVKVESEISREKGAFALFALFLREDAPDVWDLLVAAPWIEKSKHEALKFLAKKIKKYLKPEEMMKLSRMVVIEKDNPGLSAIFRAVHTEHSISTELRNVNFFGLKIKHAYLITAQRINGRENKKSASAGR